MLEVEQIIKQNPTVSDDETTARFENISDRYNKLKETLQNKQKLLSKCRDGWQITQAELADSGTQLQSLQEEAINQRILHSGSEGKENENDSESKPLIGKAKVWGNYMN